MPRRTSSKIREASPLRCAATHAGSITRSLSRDGKRMLNRPSVAAQSPKRSPSGANQRRMVNMPSAVSDANLSQDKLGFITPERTLPVPYNRSATHPLYTIHQVPVYLQDNRYILTGYRAYYSTRACLTSIFVLHNESINIWTHLIGGIIFVVLTLHLFGTMLLPEHMEGNVYHERTSPAGDVYKERVQGERTAWPLLLFGFYSFSCVMCMLCSATFHILIAHLSEPLYHCAHALDYFSITFLIVGSFLPFCYYLFSCVPYWRNVYLGMISLFGVVGLLGPFFRQWTSEAFAKKKISFYVSMVGSGMLPIMHIALFLPRTVGEPYVGGLLLMMSLYGLGVFIYAFRIPEVFAPGKFDLLFSSHQMWHVCVLAAALTHFYNCVSMYRNVNLIICALPTSMKT